MKPTKCKFCGSTNIKQRKFWTLEGKIINKKTGKPYRFMIILYDCLNCKQTFRTSDALEG